jgi:hypothetical protein
MLKEPVMYKYLPTSHSTLLYPRVTNWYRNKSRVVAAVAWAVADRAARGISRHGTSYQDRRGEWMHLTEQKEQKNCVKFNAGIRFEAIMGNWYNKIFSNENPCQCWVKIERFRDFPVSVFMADGVNDQTSLIYIEYIRLYMRCLVVRVPGYWTEMYCASCEVRTQFIYVM